MHDIPNNWLIASLKQCARCSRCDGCAMYKETAPELCKSALMRLAARRLEALSNEHN